jgi:type VI secretion system secreted protein VgrG
VRKIHGIVAEMRDEADTSQGYTRHQLRVVPRLHRLSMSFTCEAFLDKSVVDIATDKLGRVNVNSDDVQIRLQSPPAPTEFRLQYAETDLAFVSRHLERAGIAYSFDHSGDKDVLVLSDSNTPFGHAVGPSSIPYVEAAQKRGIRRLTQRSAMMAATHTVNDYLPCTPSSI